MLPKSVIHPYCGQPDLLDGQLCEMSARGGGHICVPWVLVAACELLQL